MVAVQIDVARRQNYNRIRPSPLVQRRKHPGDLIIRKNVVHHIHLLLRTALRQPKVCNIVASVVQELVRNNRVINGHRPIIYAAKEIVGVVEEENVFRMVGKGVVCDRSNGADQRSDFNSVFAVVVKYVVGDGEVGGVCRQNGEVAGVHHDGCQPVSNERAVVDEGAGGSAVVANMDTVSLVVEERGPRNLSPLVPRVPVL